MGKVDDVAEEGSVDLAWRVELLRALRTGGLPSKAVESHCSFEVVVIHACVIVIFAPFAFR